MDAVRQVFVDNRQKAVAAHKDSLAPGGLHLLNMTVTNGGGRPRQALAALLAQMLFCSCKQHVQSSGPASTVGHSVMKRTCLAR